MPDKPSRAEEEFFAKQSAELLKRHRADAERSARDASRKAHYMKCPKCGADLRTEEYHGIQIERCPECNGTWFDAGEAEDLLRREDAGVINIFRSMMKGVGG
jgi:hypothetical protein